MFTPGRESFINETKKKSLRFGLCRWLYSFLPCTNSLALRLFPVLFEKNAESVIELRFLPLLLVSLLFSNIWPELTCMTWNAIFKYFIYFRENSCQLFTFCRLRCLIFPWWCSALSKCLRCAARIWKNSKMRQHLRQPTVFFLLLLLLLSLCRESFFLLGLCLCYCFFFPSTKSWKTVCVFDVVTDKMAWSAEM